MASANKQGPVGLLGRDFVFFISSYYSIDQFKPPSPNDDDQLTCLGQVSVLAGSLRATNLPSTFAKNTECRERFALCLEAPHHIDRDRPFRDHSMNCCLLNTLEHRWKGVGNMGNAQFRDPRAGIPKDAKVENNSK